MRGAALMMASMVAFTLNDTCMKALAGDIPLMQVLFIRGILTSVMMLALAGWLGQMRFRLPRRDWALIAARTVAEVGAAWFFLTALFNMPIANVTAILQALPLTVTLAGALFLGETFGWRRLLAILTGFVGVLLIVRPGAEGFTTWSVYALIAVGFVTLRDLMARQLSRDVPSTTVAFCAAFAVTVFAGLNMTQAEWQPVDAGAAWLMLAASVFVVGGYLFSVMVMRVGDIGFVAPFRYTSLLSALALGYLVFGHWPDRLTLLGSLIVVATGLFTLYRERLGMRRAVPGLRIR